MISSGLVFNVCVGAMLIFKPVNERKITNVERHGTGTVSVVAQIILVRFEIIEF